MDTRLASYALRAAASVWGLSTAFSLLGRYKIEGLRSQLQDASVSASELAEQMASWSSGMRWTALTATVLVVASALVLAAALPRGRGFREAAGATAALVFSLALTILDGLLEVPWPEREGPISAAFAARMALWVVEDLASAAGMALLLWAPSRLSDERRAGFAAWAWTFVGLRLGALAASAPTWARPFSGQDDLLYWALIAFAKVAAFVFVAGAFWAGSQLAGSRGEAANAGATAPRRLGVDGSAFRTLGWLVLGRVGLGVAISVGVVAVSGARSFGSAGGLLVTGTILGGVMGVAVAACLVALLRLPESARGGGALVFAAVASLVGIAFDAWAAVGGVELFRLADEAKRATSFWDMPSLSRIEELGGRLTWGGRIATSLGLAAGLALLASLKATARALSAPELESTASRTMALVVVGGLGALGLGAALPSVGRGLLPLLVLAGLVLLGIGLWALAGWVGLLFELARRADEPTPPSEGLAGGPPNPSLPG